MADGLSLVVGAGAQAGDSYLVEPTSDAVSGMQVLLTDPSQLAAAAPLLTSANAVPKKLCEAGYAFRRTNLEEALRAAVSENSDA